jgi:hypothetical protein
MGGFGSGRYGAPPTAEATASYIFTASTLTAALRRGSRLTGTIHFGEEQFPVRVTIDVSDPRDPFLELTHPTRDDREPDRTIHDFIRLTWTVPTYGGRRWWFLCPRTHRLTTKLFLPNGGWHFWSREAYRLGYACQRESRFARLQRRAAKLNRQLGGEGWSTWNEPPKKPKWMRWRTYERKYEKWYAVVEKADEAFVASVVFRVPSLISIPYPRRSWGSL